MPNDTPRQDGDQTPKSVPDFDVAARQERIVGVPPYIGPLTEFDDEAMVVVTAARAALGLGPLSEMPEYFATMLRIPALFRAHMDLALRLFDGALSLRHRELAILRVGWLCRAPFEWGEHVKIAKRMTDITSEEIERVIQGSHAPGWNDEDRAIIRAVEEMHGDAMISEETWKSLARFLDEKQLMELPILVGQYQGVAYFQNSAHCRMLDGNTGLYER